MIQRISYAFRETIASFRRNVTLSVAAIITSAVSLLLVGATFLMQRAFDNLLVQWRGDVGMIVFVRPDVTPEALKFVEQNLKSQPNIIDVPKLTYLDKAGSFEEAKRVFAGDSTTLSLLSIETIPSQFKVVPKQLTLNWYVALRINTERSPESLVYPLPKMSLMSSPRCPDSCGRSPLQCL